MKVLKIEILDIDTKVINSMSIVYIDKNMKLIENFISNYRSIDDTISNAIYGACFDVGSNVMRVMWKEGIIKFTALNTVFR